jgi:hypothetical protein
MKSVRLALIVRSSKIAKSVMQTRRRLLESTTPPAQMNARDARFSLTTARLHLAHHATHAQIASSTAFNALRSIATPHLIITKHAKPNALSALAPPLVRQQTLAHRVPLARFARLWKNAPDPTLNINPTTRRFATRQMLALASVACRA